MVKKALVFLRIIENSKGSLGSKSKGLVGASDEVGLVLDGKSVRVKFFWVRPVLGVKMETSLEQMDLGV